MIYAVFNGLNSIHLGIALGFILIAIGCFGAATYGSQLQGRDTRFGLKAVLTTNGLWLLFQALGLLTADGTLSSALYIGGLIWGLTGVGAWVYFISAYTGRSYHRDRRYRLLAVGTYVSLIAIKLTNPLYGLYVKATLRSDPYPHLVVEPQLFYWVSFTLTYALVAISFYWLVDAFRKSQYPTAGLGALAVLSLAPVVPRVAVEALPAGQLPPILLGLSFEPVGVAGFTLGMLVFVEDTFRRVEQSGRSAFFEKADDATFVYDNDGDLVESNRQADQLRSALDIRCSTFDGFKRAFTPVDTDDDSGVTSVTTNGTTRYFDVSVNPMTIGAESVGTVAWVEEVTERRTRKRDLELKERAMDEAKVGITLSDPNAEDNPLIYVNDGFVEQTGYSREEVLGRNCRFLQGNGRDQPALDDLRAAIAAEEPITVDLRNYRKDGEQFWNRLSVTPIYDEDGELVNHIGIQQDVTEERTRAKRLRTLHSTTRELLKAGDMDEAVTVAVETLCEELGVDLAQMYRREADELIRVVSRGMESLDGTERMRINGSPAAKATDSGDPVVSQATEDSEGAVTKTAYFSLNQHGVIAIGVCNPTELDRSSLQLVEVLTGNLIAVLDTLERERELTRERERFQLLTEGVDGYAFVTADDDGTIETWNEGAQALFGYDAETALEMDISQLHASSDSESDPSGRLLQQAKIAGESSKEGWLARADATELYADIRYVKLETDDGEFRGYAMVVRDITEQRRQRRRTELFVKESDEVVAILDTDGTMTYVSGSAKRVLGYESDELRNENFFEYLHPDGQDAAMEEFFTAIETGTRSSQTECRVRSSDGDWLNVDSRYRYMVDNDAIDGVLVYLRDITDVKRQARRFESIFNQTYQFTGLLEPDGTVIEANEAALEFGGFDREDIVGKPFADAPWWTHSEDVNDRVRDALERAAGGEFVRYETEVRGADGLGVIDFSVKPMTDEDGDVSMLVVEGRDITDGIRRRQHLQVMQRVMRHNMRNDLTKMRGFTEALYNESDEATQRGHFETIEAILDKWTDMTEKIRQIRHVLEDYQESQATMPIADLIEDVAAEQQQTAPKMTVTTDISEAATGQVPVVMAEAVRELAENAVEATSGQNARVELTASQSEEFTSITVGDNGPGLPEAEASILETGEETSLNHGMGLGLWMVRMLTKQVGGNVRVDLTKDGTTVTLRVPTSERPLIQ